MIMIIYNLNHNKEEDLHSNSQKYIEGKTGKRKMTELNGEKTKCKIENKNQANTTEEQLCNDVPQRYSFFLLPFLVVIGPEARKKIPELISEGKILCLQYFEHIQ